MTMTRQEKTGLALAIAVAGVLAFFGVLLGGCASGGEMRLEGPFSGTYQVTRSINDDGGCARLPEVTSVTVERVELAYAPGQEAYSWVDATGSYTAFAGSDGKLYVEGMAHLPGGVNVDTWAEMTPMAGNLDGSWRVTTYPAGGTTAGTCTMVYTLTGIRR